MSNACPICAGMGSASGNEASSAAAKFEGLINALGGTSTAATALEGVLQKLGAAEGAAAAAAKLAAQTGYKAADVRRAMAAQAKEAADATRAAAAATRAASAQEAAEQKAAAREAAKEAAALARELAASEKAAAAVKTASANDAAKGAQKAGEAGQKAAEASVKAALAERKESAKAGVEAFLLRQKKAAAAKEQKQHAAETAEDFKKLTASGNRTSEMIAALKENYGLAAQGTAMMAAAAVIAVGALSALMAKAIEVSGAAMRLRESFGAFFGTGAAGGAKFVGELDKIAAKLPFTSAKIRDMAQPLINARLRGAQLAQAIQAVGAATAIMGEQGGAAATGLIKQLAAGARLNQAVWISPDMIEQFAAAGISAEVLAKQLGVSEKRLQLSTVKASVLGDVLQKTLIKNGAGSLALMGQTWDSIMGKVNEGLSSAFAGLGDIIAPFMREVQYLASELFKGSVASKATGGALRSILEPAFKAATAAVKGLHYALLYVEIAALTVYIAIKPLTDALGRASVGSTILKYVAYGLAWTFGLLAVAVFLAALPFIIIGAVILAVIVGIVWLISAISDLVGGAIGHFDNLKGAVRGWADETIDAITGFGQRAWTALSDFVSSAVTAGANFVLGLVQALFTGQGPVADAVKDLAKKAVSALFSALIIKSPSRLTAKAGGYFVQGFTDSIDEGGEDAQTSGAGLGKAAAGGLSKSAQGGGSKGGKGRDIVFNNCTFGAGVTESMLRDWLGRILEELAASGPEPEPS